VDVHYMSVGSINNFQKLFAELLSKKNTRSNNDNSHAVVNILTILKNVVNHAHSLTTPSGDDNLTLAVCQHGVQCFLLVGAKGHQCPSLMHLL